MKIKPALPRLTLIIGGLLILASMLGLIGAQLLLEEESFDLRRAASENNVVDVVLSTVSPSQIVAGQKVTVKATINTHGIQTNGVQLVLNLSGTAQPEQVAAKIIESTGLKSAYSKIEPKSTQTQVAIIALPASIGSEFSNNTDTQFLEITFVPKQNGSINITSVPDRSKVTKYKADPPENTLSQIAPLQITVDDFNPAPTAPSNPTDAPTTQPTIPTCNLTPPTNLTATFKENTAIELTWADTNSTETGFELYLIEEGSPPNGGRIISMIKIDIAPNTNHYVWQIPPSLQNRQYYHFLLRVIKSENCQKQVRSNTLYVQNISKDNLTVSFKLQGANRAGINTDGLVTLRNLNKPDADPISFFTSFKSNADGIFSPSKPISLDNLRIDPTALYQISIKTHTSLNKILGKMSITNGSNSAPEDWSKTQLKVGDYVQTDSGYNIIDIRDIGLILSQYTNLRVKAEDELALFDANYDGYFGLDDISLALSNYTKLTTRGDAP